MYMSPKRSLLYGVLRDKIAREGIMEVGALFSSNMYFPLGRYRHRRNNICTGWYTEGFAGVYKYNDK